MTKIGGATSTSLLERSRSERDRTPAEPAQTAAKVSDTQASDAKTSDAASSTVTDSAAGGAETRARPTRSTQTFARENARRREEQIRGQLLRSPARAAGENGVTSQNRVDARPERSRRSYTLSGSLGSAVGAGLETSRGAVESVARGIHGAIESGAEEAKGVIDGTVDGIGRALGNFFPQERAEGDEGFTDNLFGRPRFEGSGADERYTVTQAASGEVTLTNDTTGTSHTLAADEAEHGFSIHTFGGDDRVTIDDSVTVPVTIHAGDGDDHVAASGATASVDVNGGDGDDRIYTGAGDDMVSGGAGDDRIFTGAGADALEGGAGNDMLSGGAGRDQLRGQEGDDYLAGGSDEDFIQGGDGSDTLRGGTGSDAIYADAEDASIHAGQIYTEGGGSRPWQPFEVNPDGDVDLVVAEEGAPAVRGLGDEDSVVRFDPQAVDDFLADNPAFELEGSEDFQARTRADLGAMLATEQGRGLLEELSTAVEDRGETLRFVERRDGPGGEYNTSGRVEVGDWAATYSQATTDATGLDPNRHPLPVLFHELVHAYQHSANGGFPGGETDGVRNVELEATGLPWVDGSGTTHAENELPYTDNQFREELGLPTRTEY